MLPCRLEPLHSLKVLGTHLPKEIRTANNHQLAAMRAKLLELHDPNLLLCNMCWFKCLMHTDKMDQLFAARTHAPRMKLERRLKEQLQEGVDVCLPL